MTLDIMRAVLGLLTKRLPQLEVTFFPEQPERFHLNHPLGAVLLSFARSRFGDIQDVGMVFQPRVLHFTLTLVMRQLNGNDGAIATLDTLRQAVGGFMPPDWRRPLWLIDEVFLGQSEGLWQYALTVATETWFVQDAPQEALPRTREEFMKKENNEVAYGEVSLQR
ncbi:Gp37 family protein [Arsenophonus endosymbiont of Crataerina pallida]|uniref:Gp37 family protein n=1 Tax=Arsenophonus endosymbiont of Crataerina pallida TaxID=3066235 RepID=UPI0030CEBD9D